MKKLLLVVLLALPMSAQVCPDSIKLLSVSQGGFSLELEWDNPTDAVTLARLRLTDNATFTAEATYAYDPSDTGDGISAFVTNLDPATAYLVDIGLYDTGSASYSDYTDCQTEIAAIDCNGLTANCDPAVDADGGGAGTDLILEITTPAGDGTPTAPTAPTHANAFVEIDPATDLDNTVTVTVSGGECTNLDALMESQQTAMDAAGSNLIYGVKIPAGQICRPEHETSPLDQYTCPTITDATNKLLVYSEYPNTDAHAPFGGSVDPEAGIGGIEMNLTQPLARPLIECEGKQNIRFQRIRIARPDFTTLTYPLEPISSVSSASPATITMTSAFVAERYTDKGTSDQYGTAIVRAPGMQSRWFHGGNNPQARTSSINYWQHVIGSKTLKPYLHAFTDGGTYTSGGIVHRRIAAQFTSATKVSQPVLTFGSDHGYDNGYQYSLTSISGGVATIASGTNNDSYAANWPPIVLVSGTTGGCDGTYQVSAVTSTTWTLTGSPTGCTGGTLELVHIAMVHGISGLSYTRATCATSFPTTTTAQLLYCTDGVTPFTPDWTAGAGTITGWVSYDPPTQAPLVDISDSTNIEFEQCIIDGGEMPWRNAFLISGRSATDPIIAGSWARSQFWMATNPYTGWANDDFGENPYTYDGIINDDADGVGFQLLNNTFITGGYVYQSQNNAGVASNLNSPSDFTVDGLRVHVPDECNSEATASGGMVCGFRHFFQWKAGITRASFNGLSIDNTYQDTVSEPWAIFAEIIYPSSETTGLRGISDISVTNSYLDGVGMLQLGSGGLGGSATKPSSTHYARFLVDNNFYKRTVRRGNPQNETRNSTTYLTGFTPSIFNFSTDKLTEVQITNNTFGYPEGGPNTAWNPIAELNTIPTDDSGSSIIEWDKNIYLVAYSSTATYGKFRCSGASNAWNNCIGQKFNVMGVDGSANANFGTNYIVAVLAAPDGAADLASANNACGTGATVGVTDEWDDSGGDNGYAVHFPVVSCTDGESGNTRMDDVFTAGTYEPTGAYATYGADITDILRAQGRITDVVHQSTSTTIVLTYNAPEINGICRATATAGTGENPANDATVFFDDDTTGSYARTATITGLSSGTTYAYRIACAGGTVVRGEVATQ